MKYLKNTIIVIISSLLIKLFGLINKIFLTRFLKEQGMGLYSLILPTIMLFMSLSSFSLNTAMIKVSAKHKSKKIIKHCIIIGLITTSISSLVLLFSLHYLSSNLLKQPNTYYPILFSIPLLYLTTISSILRGYLTGLEKIGTTSIANLIEQISRILFTILIFILCKNLNITTYVIYAIIAMSIGEFCSILYSIHHILNLNINNNLTIDKKIIIELLDIAFPTTLTSLISNVTFFLEPIIFTFILTKLSISSNTILLKYSEVTTYSLPLITLFSFVPMAISTVIMPKLSTTSNKNIKTIIHKVLGLCLIFSILVSTILFKYSKEISLLLYGTLTGSNLVKKYVWFFIIFYLIPPLNTVLLSTNQAKKVFKISLFIHIIKIILLFVLPFLTDDSLIISYLITYLLTFISEFFVIIKKYNIKISFNKIITLIFYIFIIFFFSELVSFLKINFIFEIIIISIFYLLLVFRFIKRNYI